MKECRGCKITQDLVNFANHPGSKDGRRNYCNSCRNKQRKLSNGYKTSLEKHSKFLKHKWATDPNYRQKRKDYQKENLNSLNFRFRSCKKSAKDRNISFQLSIMDFDNITKQVCFYCGRFSQNKNNSGIDRINNEIGYVLANCLPCCWICNTMKLDHDQAEFFESVKLIYERHIKK